MSINRQMIDTIKKARTSLQQRQKQISTILQQYSAHHKNFLNFKTQMENSVKVLAETQGSLINKFRQNWEHLELRVKKDCNPYMELQTEFKTIGELVQLFENINTITEEHLKKYDTFCKLYMETITNEKDTLGKHKRHFDAFEKDLKELGNFKKIQDYRDLRLLHQKESLKAKTQVMDAVRKLLS